MKTAPDAERWFAVTEPPAEKAMRRVREVILRADRRMTEHVKYGTLTFAYEGDLAAFVQLKKKQVTLMFNRGALIKGRFPHLEGIGPTARFMRFTDATEVGARAEELKRIVVAWCSLMAPDSGGAAKSSSRRRPG